jgi:hypothetical protein
MIKDALIGKTYAYTPPYQLPPGITAIYYNVNSGGRLTYNGAFSLHNPATYDMGTYTIQTYAVDDAGNT